MKTTISFVLCALAGAFAQSGAPRWSWEAAPLRPDSPSRIAELDTPAPLQLGEFEPHRERALAVDGDTLRVHGLKGSLRLLGIDTEETFKDKGRLALARRNWDEYLKTLYAGVDPARPPKFGTPLGEAAWDFARDFFAGTERLRLELDDPMRREGYFGRALVHVLIRRDGAWVHYNVEVVRQGLSPYFVKYGRCRRYHELYLAAEKEARAAKRGVWATDAETPAHYPDYPARLAWWEQRARELEWVDARAAKDPTLYRLGIPSEWERLRRAAGAKVTVVGTVGRLRMTRSVALQHIGHRNRLDFLIAGPKEALRKHPLRALENELVLVTGVISLHKKQPQFRLEDVKSCRSVAAERARPGADAPLGERGKTP